MDAALDLLLMLDEGQGLVPPPGEHFRITDDTSMRITDDGNYRVTDN